MKRSRTAVAVAAACLSLITLSGCSLFDRAPTQAASEVAETSLPGGGPTGSPSASATDLLPPASGSATPSAGAPTPSPVSGYTLSQAPATVVRTFTTVSSKFDGVFSGLTARTVTKGTEATGTMIMLGLEPELVGNTTIEKNLLPGMIKGMAGQGTKATTRTIEGQNVAVAATKTTSIVAWYKAGTVVIVLGTSIKPEPALAFATAYLKAS